MRGSAPAPLLLALAVSLSIVPPASCARVAKRRSDGSAASRASDGLQVSWSKFEGPSPLGRIPAAAATCGGRLYIFGGETDFRKPDDPWTVSRYLGDLWVFTPAGKGAEGNWTQLADEGDGPVARVSASMVCSDGVLTLFGGTESSYEMLDDIWAFDLSRGRWKRVNANGGPGPLSAHTATLTDLEPDSMAVYGGYSTASGQSAKVWIYSLSSRTWSQASPWFSPTARNGHTAVAMPGTAAFRIWNGEGDYTLWEFDIRSGQWSHAGYAPAYASGRMGAYFAGRLWSFGGFTLKNGRPIYMNQLDYQNSYNNAFEEAAVPRGQVPQPRTYAAVFALDGGLWIYGGYQRPGDQERLDSLWKATPV